MLATVLLIALFIGVLVAYVAGVRQGAGWGKPVLAICTLGLVAVVLLRACGGPGGGEVDDQARVIRDTADSAELLGSLLKGNIPASGAQILILLGMRAEGGPGLIEYREGWQKGFDKALGPDGWEMVGRYSSIEPADGLSDWLDEYAAEHGENIDAVVSFFGLPEGLEDVIFYDWEPRPKVVALFPAPRETDLGAIRRWLEDGYLMAAVVLDSEGNARTYTRQLLPEVP